MKNRYTEIEAFYNTDSHELMKDVANTLKKCHAYLEQIKDDPTSIHHLKLHSLLISNSERELAEKEIEICLEIDKVLKDRASSIGLYCVIASFYRKYFETELSEKYYLKGMALAESINDSESKYKIMLQYGVLLCRSEKYIEAYKIFLELSEVKFNQDSKMFFMTLYSWLSVIEANFFNYDKSIEYSLRAINLSLAMQNYLAFAINNNSLGLTYFNMGKYDSALEAYLSAEKIALEYHNYNLLADVLHNIGLVYTNMSDNENALSFFNHSLEYREKAHNYSNQAITFSSLGDIYLDYNQLDKAEIYYKKALEIRLKYNLEYHINQSYLDICLLYSLKHQYKSAIHIIQRIIDTENKQNHAILFRAYSMMSKIYLNKKNYRKALEYLKLKSYENNLIYNNDTKQKIHVLKNKFDLEYIKQESQKKIIIEKKKTALELARMTKNHLALPVKNIRNEIQLLSDSLNELNEFDNYMTYFKKIDNANERIEEILNMFETNENISFKDYIDLIEMVEFEK